MKVWSHRQWKSTSRSCVGCLSCITLARVNQPQSRPCFLSQLLLSFFACTQREGISILLCSFVSSHQLPKRLATVSPENLRWGLITKQWGKTVWHWMEMHLFFVSSITALPVLPSCCLLFPHHLFIFFPVYTSFIAQLCLGMQLHGALLLAFFSSFFLDNYLEAESLCWFFLQHGFANNSVEPAKGHWNVTGVRAGKRWLCLSSKCETNWPNSVMQ